MGHFIAWLPALYLAIATLQLEKDFSHAIDEVIEARLLAASSREPCVNLPDSHHCKYQVLARHIDQWQLCDGTKPPSGAEHLPARRWFKIVPFCKTNFGIPVMLPPQIILRR